MAEISCFQEGCLLPCLWWAHFSQGERVCREEGRAGVCNSLVLKNRGVTALQSEAGVSRETTFSPSWPHAHLLCARHRARHQSPKQCCLGPHCRTCSLVSVTGRSVLVTTHADFDNHDNVTHASSSPGQTRRPLISEDLTIGRQVSQVVGALNSHALPKLHARPTALQ